MSALSDVASMQGRGLPLAWFLAGVFVLLGGYESITAAAANDRSISLEALSRLKGINLEANPTLKGVVLKILDQVRGTPQFVEIVRDFGLKDQESGLLQVAAKEPQSQAGTESMRLVLRSGQLDLLKNELKGSNAIPITAALGNTGEKEIVALLEPVVIDSARQVGLRKEAIKALVKVQEGAAAVLELAKSQRLPEDLKLTASMELNGVHWEQIKSQAAQVLPLPQSQNARPLPPISELVKKRGDPEHGAAVFRGESVGCSKCHQVNGQGTDFGPNLSEIGAKLAKEAIYEAILDPSAGIAFGFEAWELDLKNGDEAYGLIVSETADELALKAVGGVVTRYKKSEILKRKQQKLSIMPAGLEKTMPQQDLVDLVAYLASLKQAKR